MSDTVAATLDFNRYPVATSSDQLKWDMYVPRSSNETRREAPPRLALPMKHRHADVLHTAGA